MQQQPNQVQEVKQSTVNKIESNVEEMSVDLPIQRDHTVNQMQEEEDYLLNDDDDGPFIDGTEGMMLTEDEENALLNTSDENIMAELDVNPNGELASNEKTEEAVSNEANAIVHSEESKVKIENNSLDFGELKLMPLVPYVRQFRRPSMDCTIMPVIDEDEE